jgi:hypothetical protein
MKNYNNGINQQSVNNSLAGGNAKAPFNQRRGKRPIFKKKSQISRVEPKRASGRQFSNYNKPRAAAGR